MSRLLAVALCGVALCSACRDDKAPSPSAPKPTGTDPSAGKAPEEPASELTAASDPEPVPAMEPDEPAPVQPRPERRLKPPRGATRNEAVNKPTVSMYLADRLSLLDTVLGLRVTAEPGDFFNCHYKGRKASYYHLRLRGDGSSYLDGYLPRDAAGEKLWEKLQGKGPHRITVQVTMRASTVSDVCVGQVEILDHRHGWDYAWGRLGKPGTLQRRLKNMKDRKPALNRPSINTFLGTRKRYIDRRTSFRVRARLGRYYQCRYRDAERTHYALELTGDGYKGLRAYIPRNDRGRALAQHLAHDEGARITVEVTVPKGRFDEVCSDQVEVIDWYKGWGQRPEIGAEEPEQ